MKLLITAPSPPPKRSSLWNLLILKLAKKCIHNTIYPRDWHLPLVFVFNWPLTNIQNTLSKNRYSQRSCKRQYIYTPPPQSSAVLITDMQSVSNTLFTYLSLQWNKEVTILICVEIIFLHKSSQILHFINESIQIPRHLKKIQCNTLWKRM